MIDRDIGKKVIESQENIIDTVCEDVDALFNIIQCDIDQFLYSEDMLNQYMGHFQPYFLDQFLSVENNLNT
jgi:hypothetical protein